MLPPRLSFYLAVLLILAAAIIAYSVRAWSSESVPTTEAAARAIVAECSKVAGDHSPCYESEVPNLYPRLTVPQISEVVRKIMALDPTYQYCHVLGHKIGERVVAEDPSRWVADIGLAPADGLCSNGYLHGVIAGRFRSEVLDDATIQEYMPQFSEVCQPSAIWNPSESDREECYHAMGHLFDFITNANIPKALELCSQTIPSAFQYRCYEGVFMQIFRPHEPEDRYLFDQLPVKPTKDTVRTWCASFANPDYIGACLRESWAYFQDEVLSGTGVGAFCSGQPNADQEKHCYEIAFSAIAWQYTADPKKLASICAAVPSSEEEYCFDTVAMRMFGEDKTNGSGVVALCKDAPTLSLQNSCLSDTVAHLYDYFGTEADAYQSFCGLLPDPLRGECFAKESP